MTTERPNYGAARSSHEIFGHDESVTVYALWSAPRSRSTAFFRSMLERGDVIAAHEPFFDLHSHGRVEIDSVAFTTIDELLNGLRSRTGRPDLFLKETTDHRYDAVLADRRFLAEARHAFLIRQPAEIAASYHALYPAMRQHEIGLETLHELYWAVVDAGGHKPVVIDSDDLVANPAATVAAYCDAMGLRFLPHALSWTSGDRPEWRQTARWHARTASSTGFEPGGRRYDHDVETSKRLAAFAAHHQPLYDRLRTLRLTVSAGSETGDAG